MKAKPTANEKGYLTRADAAKALRQIADEIEAANDGMVVKLVIQAYALPDDGSCVDGDLEIHKDAGARRIAPSGH